MKTKCKKIMQIALLVLLVSIAIIGVFRAGMRLYNHFTYDKDASQKSSIKSINEYGVKVYVYGEALKFHESLKYDKVNNLDFVKEDIKAKSVYLIINDFNGDATLTEENVKAITEFADKNEWFNYIYIGKDKLQMIREYFIETKRDRFSGDMSMTYVVSDGERGSVEGVWSSSDMENLQKNEDLLEEQILLFIEQCIKSN